MKSATKIKIFIADEIHSSGIDNLKRSGFDVITKSGLDNNSLLKFISQSSPITQDKTSPSVLIIRTIRKLDKSLIKKLYELTNIRILCTASSGYDNIDVDYARNLGMKVLSSPEGSYISAAEHTFALILDIAKNIENAGKDMKSGIFDFKRYNNFELNGKTIGIIGVGRVGSTVAKIARSFNIKILGNDIKKSLTNKYKWIKFVSLNKLLSSSDIVTIHTPLDNTTRHLLNSGNLKFLKKGAILINCSRGGTIEESALLRLLKQNKIYAGIDVFEKEPEFNKEFSKLNNVVLTPHLAGKTRESKEKMSLQLSERIIMYFGS